MHHLQTVLGSLLEYFIVSNIFYYRNILVRVKQEGIYNSLSHRKTRYWDTILYYTLDQTTVRLNRLLS
jgi:hypothetical protein